MANSTFFDGCGAVLDRDGGSKGLLFLSDSRGGIVAGHDLDRRRRQFSYGALSPFTSLEERGVWNDHGLKTALLVSRAFSCKSRLFSASFFSRAISRCGASRSSSRKACASAVLASASSRRDVTTNLNPVP
jgi:hypothetical protein